MHFQNGYIKLYTVVLFFFVFPQNFNKIMLSLELEPQINCQQLPRTRVSDSRPKERALQGWNRWYRGDI